MGLHDHLLPSAAAEPSRIPKSRLRATLAVAMLLASSAIAATVVAAEEPSTEQPTAGQRSPDQRTWQLSIINGGQPRGAGQSDAKLQNDAGEGYHPFAEDNALNAGKWLFQNKLAAQNDGQPPSLGRKGAVPVTGDFNGDGHAEMGVFIDGQWFIDLNGNGRWDDNDLWAKLGGPGDQPVVGDWDGDGKADIGVWGAAGHNDNAALVTEAGLPDAAHTARAKTNSQPHDAASPTRSVRLLRLTSEGPLRADAVDHVFDFGGPDAVAVVGDFNGDGIDTIGVFRQGQWLLDSDGDGKLSASETEHTFGDKGDVPVVGDFNGDGVDEIGVYRKGVWHLDTNGNQVLDEGDAELRLGGDHDAPAVGDFDGDGTDELGVYRTSASDQD